MQYSTISQNTEYPLSILNTPVCSSMHENSTTITISAIRAVRSSTANTKRFRTGIAKNRAKNAVKYQNVPNVTGMALFIRLFTLQLGFSPAIVSITVTTNE